MTTPGLDACDRRRARLLGRRGGWRMLMAHDAAVVAWRCRRLLSSARRHHQQIPQYRSEAYSFLSHVLQSAIRQSASISSPMATRCVRVTNLPVGDELTNANRGQRRCRGTDGVQRANGEAERCSERENALLHRCSILAKRFVSSPDAAGIPSPNEPAIGWTRRVNISGATRSVAILSAPAHGGR